MGVLVLIFAVGVLLGAVLWLASRRGETLRDVQRQLPDPSNGNDSSPQRVIPPLEEQYFLAPDSLSADQLSFFRYLVEELLHGRRPPVDGQFGYLLLHASQLLRQWQRVDMRKVHAHLLDLSEAYCDEPKFGVYARMWAYDCLLVLGAFSEFLRVSEPTELFATDTHGSNLRCNVAYHLNRPASVIDLLRMSSVSVTGYTKKYPVAFKELLEKVLLEEAERNGPWLDRLIAAGHCERVYRHSVFRGGAGSGPELPFLTYCFYTGIEVLKESVREAEQRLRDLNAVPRVGEGWVGETEIYHFVKKAFPQIEVVHHGRPAWLGMQHLDIWIPDWRVGVEYHGVQHFRPVEYFGGEEAFQATKERDARKARLCLENAVALFVVTAGTDPAEVVKKIEEVRVVPTGGKIIHLGVLG